MREVLPQKGLAPKKGERTFMWGNAGGTRAQEFGSEDTEFHSSVEFLLLLCSEKSLLPG